MPIVIQLPRVRSLIISSAFLLGVCAFTYWFQKVRPYLTLPNAHVNAYSTLIGSDTSGRIVALGPQEGDSVRKGDLLFAFDQELLLAKQLQLKASLEALGHQVSLEKERMIKAMDSYLAIEMGLGSDEIIQRHLRVMEEAQAKSEDISAQIQSLQTELDLRELELKKRAFSAPFDGIILKRYKNEGAVVSLGEPVYSLCDPKRLWIEAQVPETELHAIALGTVAKIRLAAYPHKEWTGKISYIGSATSSKNDDLPLHSAPVTIPVKISFESQDPLVKPGLFAIVDLKVR